MGFISVGTINLNSEALSTRGLHSVYNSSDAKPSCV
jgi:hypothetical protein